MTIHALADLGLERIGTVGVDRSAQRSLALLVGGGRIAKRLDELDHGGRDRTDALGATLTETGGTGRFVGAGQSVVEAVVSELHGHLHQTVRTDLEALDHILAKVFEAHHLEAERFAQLLEAALGALHLGAQAGVQLEGQRLRKWARLHLLGGDVRPHLGTEHLVVHLVGEAQHRHTVAPAVLKVQRRLAVARHHCAEGLVEPAVAAVRVQEGVRGTRVSCRLRFGIQTEREERRVDALQRAAVLSAALFELLAQLRPACALQCGEETHVGVARLQLTGLVCLQQASQLSLEIHEGDGTVVGVHDVHAVEATTERYDDVTRVRRSLNDVTRLVRQTGGAEQARILTHVQRIALQQVGRIVGDRLRNECDQRLEP
mmetsp:Transcript_40372/g.101611  ORF Transcript_40372/g.101611 Transcript_40372/m.101611 type:complete len:374 (+) Transcript_40372:406-1527(+)